MTMRLRLIGGLLLLFAAAAPRPAFPQVPAPAETFFAPPSMQHAALSPSGRWLGALVSVPGRRISFEAIDLDGKLPPRTVEASSTDDVAWFEWFDDDWVLFVLQDTEQLRHVVRGPGLLAMRRDGRDARQLIARGNRDMPDGALPPGHVYLGRGAPGSMELIMGRPRYDAAGEFMYMTLLAYDIATQQSRRIHEDAPRAEGWMFDPQGRPRLILQRDDQQLRYLWADADGARVGPWREIAAMPMMEPAWTPAYIDADGRLFVTTQGPQGMELRRFDFAKGRPAAEAVLATPGFSGGVAALRTRPDGRVIGVKLALDAPTTEWLVPALRELQDRVDARWPGRVNVISGRPPEQPQRVLVFSYADNDPGQFLLYQPQQDKWQLLGSVRPDIQPQQMARMVLERIRARDGRELPLWVTRLPGPVDKPRPAVVVVHGGPFLRGASWAWRAEAQFLASRGYVVIEPEFRGSTGWGYAHYRAGWKQWGGTMIDDITDALRHVVNAGIADPKRVCVMGSSYGGYATLMSLVKEPDLYRCGIAHAAVTDLRHRFEIPWSDLDLLGRRVVLPLTMGDLHDDAAMFVTQSPLEQVQRIKAPVLLLHGDDDLRVPVQNGERMRDALKKAGKQVEWVLYPDEGHGFSRPANELDYWRRVETFLSRHLQ